MTRPQVELYKDPFIWIMIGLYAVSISLMLATFIGIFFTVNTDDRMGQIFLVRMLQITLGIVIGSTMTFLGMVTAWFGLKDEMSGEGEATLIKLKLVSASPGALLIIAGTLLIYVCVTKDVTYNQSTIGTDFRHAEDPIVTNVPANHAMQPSGNGVPTFYQHQDHWRHFRPLIATVRRPEPNC